ncbi:MAG: hypothetical protein R2932_39240 [Caldilineaceae bacterium]
MNPQEFGQCAARNPVGPQNAGSHWATNERARNVPALFFASFAPLREPIYTAVPMSRIGPVAVPLSIAEVGCLYYRFPNSAHFRVRVNEPTEESRNGKTVDVDWLDLGRRSAKHRGAQRL